MPKARLEVVNVNWDEPEGPGMWKLWSPDGVLVISWFLPSVASATREAREIYALMNKDLVEAVGFEA